MKNFRFFIRQEEISGAEIVINSSGAIHKIKDVLRYQKGDEIAFYLSPSKEYFGEVSAISSKQITVSVTSVKELKAPPLFITLYLSLIKTKNFEAALQKATELGVSRIVPFAAERSIVKVKPDDNNKMARWSAIVAEAACQCKRATMPDIAPIISVKDLQNMRDDAQLKIVCNERSNAPLKELLRGAPPPISVSAAIGPEGSFTDKEIDAFIKQGFKPALFGDTILRCETAAIFIVSTIKYEFGENLL